ncbi:Arc family DNA-binding protein [Dysgonomonas sp. OttesenSCG-928-M03]|nr:Arc family DNA-binding protein [Dysgonomonas sp. OttesenSCG-928-M03]
MAKKEKESTVKSFVLRVDQEMMEAIEKWAADEFRSTNGQIQYILDQALRKAGRIKKVKPAKKDEAESDQ